MQLLLTHMFSAAYPLSFIHLTEVRNRYQNHHCFIVCYSCIASYFYAKLFSLVNWRAIAPIDIHKMYIKTYTRNGGYVFFILCRQYICAFAYIAIEFPDVLIMLCCAKVYDKIKKIAIFWFGLFWGAIRFLNIYLYLNQYTNYKIMIYI